MPSVWRFFSYRENMIFKDELGQIATEVRMYNDNIIASEIVEFDWQYVEDLRSYMHVIGGLQGGYRGFFGGLIYLNYAVTDFTMFLGTRSNCAACNSGCPLPSVDIECNHECHLSLCYNS
jgi:hypothetical protein